MSKKIILFFLFIYANLILYPNNNEIKFITRNAAILPIVNSSDNKDYDFLSFLIEDNLRKNLSSGFILIDQSMTKFADADIKNYNIELIENFALTIQSDVVIFGEFFINSDEINLNIKSYDVIKRNLIDNSNYKINIKNDLTFFSTKITTGYSLKIKEHFSIYDEALVELIRQSDKENSSRKKILENFYKNNQDHFWNYIIVKSKNKEYISIPFAKNTVIFFCENTGNYSVSANDNKNENDSNIKIFSFENKPGNQIDFTVKLNNNQEILYKYKQIKDYEIDVKYIKLINEKSNDHLVFIDNSISISTAAIAGYDFKFGFGIPIKSKLDNNFYLKTFMGIKTINPVNIGKQQVYEDPYYKFRISAGYEHIFYLKKIIAVMIGLEFGYEFYLYKFLIKNYEKTDYAYSIWGNPSFSLSFPVALQFFTNTRFNLIFGFEPVLRFVANYYYVNNTPIREYLDESRGTILDFLRFKIDDYLTVDLFIYDMPIFLAFRIKI